MPGSGWQRAWPRVPSWTRSEMLHEWIRSGGILIAAAWGVYTFVWKDILVPSWQPAHLNLDASLTPVAGRPASPEGQDMTLELKASNASSRRVYLLPNVWWLTDIRRDRRRGEGQRLNTDFLSESTAVLRGVGLRQSEREVVDLPAGLLAVGRLFDDDFLDPGAALRRTILVRVPPGTTAAELRVILPLLTRRPQGLFPGQRLAWGLADAMDPPMLLLCPAAGGDVGRPPSDCQPVPDDIDATLQRFDPRKSTITLQLQIGLPGGLGPTP